MSPLALLEAVKGIGLVKVVVRNDYTVMERTGTVQGVVADGLSLCVQGSNFRLTLRSARLGGALALEEERPRGIKRSIVLHDLSGAWIAKLVLRESSDVAAFRRLNPRCRAASLDVTPKRAVTPLTPERPPGASLAWFLASAAALGLRLGIAVRNRAARLDADTALQRIKRSERAPWINVLDAALHLHLFEREIATLAVERLPEGALFRWLARDGTEAFCAAAPAGPAHRSVRDVSGSGDRLHDVPDT